jgi:hypothetical protein
MTLLFIQELKSLGVSSGFPPFYPVRLVSATAVSSSRMARVASQEGREYAEG